MADTNQLNDAHEMQVSANKEGLNKYQEFAIAKGESRSLRKDLIAEIANPFAISQEQGEQYADSGQTMSDAINCDINGDGQVKGPKERICQVKADNEAGIKEIAEDKADIAKIKADTERLKAETEKLKQIKGMLQGK